MKDFACRQQHWGLDERRNVVFVDESAIEYNPWFPLGGRIRLRAGEELEGRNIQASFNLGRTKAGIYNGRRTKLIMIRKRTPAERVLATDGLGLNAVQCTTELDESHFIQFPESFDVSPDHLMLAADGARCIRELKIPNCARTPGTDYFLGHPTHQILTPSKVYGLLETPA